MRSRVGRGTGLLRTMSGREGRSLTLVRRAGEPREGFDCRRALFRRIVLCSKCRAKAGAAPGDGIDAQSDDLRVRRTERTHVVDDSLERANRLLEGHDPTPGSNLVCLRHRFLSFEPRVAEVDALPPKCVHSRRFRSMPQGDDRRGAGWCRQALFVPAPRDPAMYTEDATGRRSLRIALANHSNK